MTRASPSTKLLRTANKHLANKTSSVNETRTGTKVVVEAPPEELKKRAKTGSVVDNISRIKEVVAVVRTANLSSSRDEVEVEPQEMDNPSIKRRILKLASRISHKVQLLIIKVQPQCRQDLLRHGLCEVVWDKIKTLK